MLLLGSLLCQLLLPPRPVIFAHVCDAMFGVALSRSADQHCPVGELHSIERPIEPLQHLARTDGEKVILRVILEKRKYQ